jgi:hypothetical protein
MAVDVAESAVGHGGRDTKAAATARAAVVTVMVTQVVAAMGVATVVAEMGVAVIQVVEVTAVVRVEVVVT